MMDVGLAVVVVRRAMSVSQATVLIRAVSRIVQAKTVARMAAAVFVVAVHLVRVAAMLGYAREAVRPIAMVNNAVLMVAVVNAELVLRGRAAMRPGNVVAVVHVCPVAMAKTAAMMVAAVHAAIVVVETSVGRPSSAFLVFLSVGAWSVVTMVVAMCAAIVVRVNPALPLDIALPKGASPTVRAKSAVMMAVVEPVVHVPTVLYARMANALVALRLKQMQHRARI